MEAKDWFEEGNEWFEKGSFSKAFDCYEKWLDTDVVTSLNETDSKTALANSEKALQENPNNERAWLFKGLAYNKLKKHLEAIECFDKAIELDPNYARIYNNKGNALNSLGEHRQAIECYDKAIKINPDYVNAYYNKGVALYDLGKYQQAIECYDKAIELEPDYADAYNNKGNALLVLGEYQQAIEYYDKAIELEPDNAKMYNNKGSALCYLGEYEQAIECFDKAIELNPDYAETYYNKGNVLLVLGEYQQAIECYDKAIELDPNDADAYNNKGLALENLNRFKEAVKCYKRVLTINPQHYEASIRKNNIVLNEISASEKEEYKNEELKEFDKFLYYAFAIPFSSIKEDDINKLEQKMLNNIHKNVVSAKLRIEVAVKSPNTNYEYQIAQCTSDEFPIVFVIYYCITGKISPDVASVLLLYCAKKMDNDSIQKFGDVIKAVSPEINILLACKKFLESIQNTTSTTIEVWNKPNDYDLFKENLPEFLAEERKKLGEKEFTDKYYFVDYLKEYRKIFD